MITSVRDALGVGGGGVSIRQLADERNLPLPLSVRQLVGAPAPGRILRKAISLDFLQRKLDVLFNQRARPLFQFRFHGTRYGESALTVAFDDPVTGYDHNHALLTKELAGPGERLSFSVAFVDYYYFFQDVKSDALTVNVTGGQSCGLELRLQFETGGPVDMRVDGNTGPNIDFKVFKITFRLAFEVRDGRLDLTGFVDTFNPRDLNLTRLKQFIDTDVSVDARVWPDGLVAGSVEDRINIKIFEALGSARDPESNRSKLNKIVTRWLLGGDFQALAVSHDDDTQFIDYVIPPGQLEPFPENPQPPLDAGPLSAIDHIVVLMMENRSFDHMLGYLRKDGDATGKKRTDIDGLDGTNKNRYQGRDYPSLLLPDTHFLESPPHEHTPVQNQIDGGRMDLFVSEFARKHPAVDPGRIMGYHNADRVPVYDTLAREFLVCQRWFSAHPGPTFCNRFYTLTGRLNRDSFGSWELDNFSGDAFKPVSTRTLFDHLTERGVSWRYYEQRYCTLRLFERYTTDDTFIVDARDETRGFFASARAGTLPAVSFIDPNFVDETDEGDNDDGAPADITAGQRLVGEVVQAVMSGPLWSKTLLLITYDEHGGFYDHVPPPPAVPVSGLGHYGVRVPTFVVSPWVDRGTASNVTFDHTSIAKTISRRFMSASPPDMGERVAAAEDLSKVLRKTPRTDKPTLALPPLHRRRGPARPARTAERDDFKEVLRLLRARYPLRRHP